MRKIFILSTTILLAACQPEAPTKNNQSEQSVVLTSVKDVKFQGPGATCSDIDLLLKSSPPDMTDKQKRIAELSREACILPGDDITLAKVKTALGDSKIKFATDGNELTLYAKHKEDTAYTCCSIQANLGLKGEENGQFYFGSRFNLKNLDEARLEFFAPDYFASEDKVKIFYKGPNAAPDREMNVDELKGQLSEYVFESQALDEKRKYSVYTPPGFQAGDDVGLVVMGDGTSLSFHSREWEPLFADGRLGKIVVIGVYSGKRSIANPSKEYDFDIRNSDYIKGYTKGPQRFDAHLEFVTDELVPHVKHELNIDPPVERTVLMGGSSGGSFALWGVMSRPDVFGMAIGTSPSGPIPDEISELASQRNYFLSAGIYEPGFRYNAEAYNAVFVANGIKSELKLYSDGHSNDSRAQRMVEVLPRIFPTEN